MDKPTKATMVISGVSVLGPDKDTRSRLCFIIRGGWLLQILEPLGYEVAISPIVSGQIF